MSIDNGNTDNFGPILDGISIPDTVVLPPEVVMLLPWMSLAELKVVIAAVARLMQVGGAEPITLTEFQELTGLSRTAVLDGIERAIKRGLLMRFEMTGYRGHTMHVYELKPRFIGSNFLPITPLKAKQSKVNVVESDSELTTTNLTLLNLSERAKILQKTPENEAKSMLFVRLHRVGIYAKTARFLVDNFPPERIEKCLALYPMAVKAGRADGPGWLVKAVSDSRWDLDIEQADLEERIEAKAHREKVEVKPAKPQLPKSVLEDLRKIGWSGGTGELLSYYRSERKAFKAWLDWAKSQPVEHAAARFLTGLRSGTLPPVVNRYSDNRHKYIEGEYGEFVEH
ncbi:MAG: hypothetical protein KatS3mg047_1519 [Bellilinea sp.]|nr:MAG: hypothetical protein KatS3mg047_1519 [Bellilinea sp.]